MTDAATHLDLLAIARRVRAAAGNDDVDDLHAELAQLRAAVLVHVQAERAALDGLSDSAAVVVLDGQRRLLRLLTDVLSASSGRDGDECSCLVRAAQIELALLRQARVEAALFGGHPHPGASAGPSPGIGPVGAPAPGRL